MGVPALFRWLSQKYPKIISQVIEHHPEVVDGVEVPVDISEPNPNGEFDNLYLDMNGIVHPCSHPEDRPPPENEEEMMLAVFKYTERVFNMVRPRKLLLIAVDGVAPRAKMNQQRSRRFRSAQEAKEKDEEKAELMKMLKAQNGGVLEEETEARASKKTWDSNAITPGTPFMDILAASLRYWCSYKTSTDPAWRKVKVIISDATVPGEGEHKIMEFIRSQRSSPAHDPNTKHVIYGLDADLIMLGLATHEPHFRVLREDVFFQESKARTCHLCGQKGHIAEACKGEAKPKDGEFGEKDKALADKPFIWLHVSVLREYLEAELHVPQQGFGFDLERALDDWVFMCFFVGNDFLPHLPSLDIRENGIDTLIAIWRDNLPAMRGYLTKDGHVDLERCQYILDGLAKQEDAIFRRRKETEDRRDANAKRRRIEQENRNGGGMNGDKRSGGRGRRGSPDYSSPSAGSRGRGSAPDPTIAPPDMPLFIPGKGYVTREERAVTHDMVVNRGAVFKANIANKSAAAALKQQLLNGNQAKADSTDSPQSQVDRASQDERPDSNFDQSNDPATPISAAKKRKADLMESDDNSTPGQNTPDTAAKPEGGEDETPSDTVRLWDEGYADRYYEQKFKVDPKDIAFRNQVARDYVEGLAWVLLYYFQGCPSWTWYYPHHYAPFAADFVDIEKMDVKFEKGRPFKPFEQLMGVLPAASNHAIPEVFRSLMTDEDSSILDFYPTDFPIDLNGKKFAWQGVALLPFIDEKRLLDAMATKYPLLSAEDTARNEMGRDVLIVSEQHPLHFMIEDCYSKPKQLQTSKYDLDSKKSDRLTGEIEKIENYIPASTLYFPLGGDSMPDLDPNHSLSVYYEMPRSNHIHKSMLLRGVEFLPPTLARTDIEATKNAAARTGRSFGGAPLRGGPNNGRGRGGRINYAEERPNPFAAHIDPNFVPPPFAYNRGQPPAPGHFNDNRHYSSHSRDNGYYNGSHRGSHNDFYQNPPPPPYPNHGYNQNYPGPDNYRHGPPNVPPPMYGNQQYSQYGGQQNSQHGRYGYGNR